MICKQCGKELDGVFATNHQRTCQVCKRENDLARARVYYARNSAEIKAEMRRRRREKLAKIGSMAKHEEVRYCVKQRGADDLGCLDCKLPQCVQVAYYRGETENSTGFKQRYEQLRETTWKAREQELDVHTELNALITRTPIAGNGRNKHVRNNIGRR